MKLFRLGRKRKRDEEARDVALDADSDQTPDVPAEVVGVVSEGAQDAAPGDTPGDTPSDPPGGAPGPAVVEGEAGAEAAEGEAEAVEEAPPEAPASQDDLLARMSSEVEAEVAAEEQAAADGGTPSEDDELAPELLDIFRDARNEVQEGSLAAELEEVSAKDLLTDVLGVSQRLGISSRREAPVASGGESDHASATDAPVAEEAGHAEPQPLS